MKKLTYILLFIWNIGIGQTELIIGDVIYSKECEGLGTEFSPFKYDTIKAVLMSCDSLDEVDTKFLRSGEQVVIGTRSYGNTYFYWIYGYVIIQSEFTMISCPDGRIGCAVAHYGYGNKKTIGYLDLSKKPFSKEIIIWDYKIIE